MKKKTLGIIIGIILSSAIATFIEFCVFIAIMCCDCGRQLWITHQSLILFLIFLLAFSGFITNFLTQTKEIFEKFKQGAIIGITSSLICFFVIFVIGFLPNYTQSEGLSLLSVLSDFPILLFLPLFTGSIVIGSLLVKPKESIAKSGKNKTIFSIILALILIIIPIWVNVSLANEEHALNDDWAECFSDPSMDFTKDDENMTLTLNSISMYDLDWDEFQVSYGNASLPIGNVDIGDVITNCSQEGHIVWITCGIVVYSWNFD